MKTTIFLLVIVMAISCNNSSQKQVEYGSNELKLTDSINRIVLKNNSIYNLIEEEFVKSPAIVGNSRRGAYELKVESDEIFNYLQYLKLNLIKFADGVQSPAIHGREINIAKVSHLNSISVPKEIMLGANDNGKAYEVRALLDEYKSILDTIVKDNPVIMNNINNTINLTDHKLIRSGKDNININWAIYTFNGKSLGEVLIELSRLQFDVKNIESDILSFLNKNILTEIKRDSIKTYR